ncbi:hypothetical protein OG897_40120 [Streptomyces sp. NBC_00237]|uniref:hypothetical protein n=1 Tax=Streptomyces sp. NBC_00237 TaxID=2975687 RepID=UPI00225BD104|nr:hypothetical protein [Streptomyces sp. NBC_00237]MCX5207599.1 hypothetical protein [Streptomyces sp. NBC_00237]
MQRTAYRASLAVADAVTGGLDTVTAVIGGAAGAWAAYTHTPATWPTDGRLALAGGVAVVSAVAANSLADLFLAPLRRRVVTARGIARPAISQRPGVPVPDTLPESLAQVAAATGADAAVRAATDAWNLDRSEGFLRNEDRWRGYEDGTASYFLAPGVWLVYRAVPNQFGRASEYTLLTGDGEEPVPVTYMEEIRHQLAARAAGLPAAPLTDDSDRGGPDDVDRKADDHDQGDDAEDRVGLEAQALEAVSG